ncbi:MAG: hypothetical protein V2A34_01910, partial [Lentisphaerota bacterium]
DFGLVTTGLVDGFHVISARAFLQRPGQAAIYNTFVQPFYLDLETPQGEIKYPSAGDTLWQNEYGAVVRTDPTVKEVWFNVLDENPANDDAQTGNANGNGTNAAGQTAWATAYSITPSLSIPSVYPDEWRFSYRAIPTNGQSILRVRLMELSSSTNFSYTAVDGHYTELVRTNYNRAPDTTFEFGWPENDSERLEAGWEIWVRFSKSLVDPFNDTDMLNRFLIKINDVAQGRDNYAITRDIGGGFGKLAFAVPDLYNGNSNFQHHIAVTFLNQYDVTLETHRYARIKPTSSGPSIQITDPPEYDSDGQPFVLTLPDVASPSSTQRMYQIQVETDLSARNVWLIFTNSTGFTYRLPSITNLLTGTVSVIQGSNGVTGAGTLFDSQISTGNRLLIGAQEVIVAQVQSSNALLLTAAFPGSTASGLAAQRLDGNPYISGSKQYWSFLWTNIAKGSYTFNANVNTNDSSEGSVHAYAMRNTRVIYREMVNSDTNNLDDDDDGLYDSAETNPTNLPSSNAETWDNGDVHIWQAYGRSDPLLPDTDGDGLMDGLELGWQSPDISQTDTNADTNGDGWRNFASDFDPPFYNIVDSCVPGYNFNGSRTTLLKGSMTDPSNPDSDYDGISDGVEDANRNGWVDGDGTALNPGDNECLRSSWPDGVWDSAWQETDPNNADSDRDGASDGYSEDTNFNGRIEGDANSNRVYNAGEAWSESNPLNPDTDGDGLPDGWETQYGLDPLDSGTDSYRTSAAGDGNADNGPNGNPDGDQYVVGGVTNNYINLQEYQNGTNPRYFDSLTPPPPGAITIGPGPVLAVVNGVTNYQEFMEWSWDDLKVLDEVDGEGNNNQGGDLYLGWDGYDTSRDIVAFYAHDGGDDGNYYFRVDFHDLQAHAEEGFLDLYVVIDTGNPASGEMGIPDDVDATTSNRWEAIVAVYQSNQGAVYVDLDRAPEHNSTTVNDSYNLSAFGVERRDQNHANGFRQAYFNSELDSVEFSISRQAL